jgi:hypothetical protein
VSEEEAHLRQLFQEARKSPFAVGVTLRNGKGFVAQVGLETALDLGEVGDATAAGREGVSIDRIRQRRRRRQTYASR